MINANVHPGKILFEACKCEWNKAYKSHTFLLTECLLHSILESYFFLHWFAVVESIFFLSGKQNWWQRALHALTWQQMHRLPKTSLRCLGCYWKWFSLKLNVLVNALKKRKRRGDTVSPENKTADMAASGEINASSRELHLLKWIEQRGTCVISFGEK